MKRHSFGRCLGSAALAGVLTLPVQLVGSLHWGW